MGAAPPGLRSEERGTREGGALKRPAGEREIERELSGRGRVPAGMGPGRGRRHPADGRPRGGRGRHDTELLGLPPTMLLTAARRAAPATAARPILLLADQDRGLS